MPGCLTYVAVWQNIHTHNLFCSHTRVQSISLICLDFKTPKTYPPQIIWRLRTKGVLQIFNFSGWELGGKRYRKLDSQACVKAHLTLTFPTACDHILQRPQYRIETVLERQIWSMKVCRNRRTGRWINKNVGRKQWPYVQEGKGGV